MLSTANTKVITSTLVAIMAMGCVSIPAGEQNLDEANKKVLLLGNSILYSGNVPATLAKVSDLAGEPFDVSMYAQAGAKVSDIVNDEFAMGLLRNGNYDAVVFHDQGGNSFCLAEPQIDEECENVLQDHQEIADAIRMGGAVPFLLGTYQLSPTASKGIEKAEARIAEELSVKHIPVSETWQMAMSDLPESRWLAKDGMHPGPTLTVMMAMEIYEAVSGGCPPVLSIDFPVFNGIPSSEREGTVYVARTQEPLNGSQASVDEVRAILAITSPRCVNKEVD